MIRYIENPGIVRTVYSEIFRYIQGHLAIFSHGQASIQTCSGILRDINPFVPNAPFLYPLKTSKNRKVF